MYPGSDTRLQRKLRSALWKTHVWPDGNTRFVIFFLPSPNGDLLFALQAVNLLSKPNTLNLIQSL